MSCHTTLQAPWERRRAPASARAVELRSRLCFVWYNVDAGTKTGYPFNPPECYSSSRGHRTARILSLPPARSLHP